MNRSLILAFAATCAIACSTPEGMGDTASGADATADTMESPDVQMTAETGASETGSGRDFGSCGASLHTCICNCMNNQSCIQNCVTMASETCQRCIITQQAMCCPTEANAYAMCLQNAQMTGGCMDSACVMMMCSTQITAFNGCLMTQASMPACQARIAMCVGTDQTCP